MILLKALDEFIGYGAGINLEQLKNATSILQCPEKPSHWTNFDKIANVVGQRWGSVRKEVATKINNHFYRFYGNKYLLRMENKTVIHIQAKSLSLY